ncbi:hypothetical protein C8R46DRAFT_1044556 [Mycena filopes]|nr:hypothetical protein C8R46DRAFT_1044556 [Mycena filopes]
MSLGYLSSARQRWGSLCIGGSTGRHSVCIPGGKYTVAAGHTHGPSGLALPYSQARRAHFQALVESGVIQLMKQSTVPAASTGGGQSVAWETVLAEQTQLFQQGLKASTAEMVAALRTVEQKLEVLPVLQQEIVSLKRLLSEMRTGSQPRLALGQSPEPDYDMSNENSVDSIGPPPPSPSQEDDRVEFCSAPLIRLRRGWERRAELDNPTQRWGVRGRDRSKGRRECGGVRGRFSESRSSRKLESPIPKVASGRARSIKAEELDVFESQPIVYSAPPPRRQPAPLPVRQSAAVPLPARHQPAVFRLVTSLPSTADLQCKHCAVGRLVHLGLGIWAGPA